MKAMIFAAGLGSRLGEITRTTPKSLVEAGGKTMLEHVVERLKKAGVNSIIINLFHLAEEIEKFIALKNNFGIEVSFSREKELLGTGGGLQQTENFFAKEQDFFIYNSDIYCELDLNTLLAYHRSHNALATLVSMKRESSRQLIFDSEGKLIGWEAKENQDNLNLTTVPNYLRLAFAGIHVCTPAIFDAMRQEQGNFSIIKSYLSAAKNGSLVQAYNLEKDFWIDVGKPETLQQLRERLA